MLNTVKFRAWRHRINRLARRLGSCECCAPLGLTGLRKDFYANPPVGYKVAA